MPNPNRLMDFDVDLTPASTFDLSLACAKDITRSLLRMALKNVKRTDNVVDAEYNSGAWDRLLNERTWLRSPSLDAFLTGQNTTMRLAKVDNRFVRVSAKDYYRYRNQSFSELITQHAGDATSLLELAAGAGHNLFSLSLNSRWTRLRGLDISATP
ncbi:hypothetical protein [Bradyrhizobium lablabi]|uniref:hypothetical protein n=1 Tax=Bradyrhizobium lablabi TaxID=722472 RepID=UPI0020113FBF|nr:hypothetical protein [Bradyrhizobium lablabi]